MTSQTPVTIDGLSNLLDQVISALFVANENGLLTADTILEISDLAQEARIALDGEIDPTEWPITNHDDLREELSDQINDVLSEAEGDAITETVLAAMITPLETAFTLIPTGGGTPIFDDPDFDPDEDIGDVDQEPDIPPGSAAPDVGDEAGRRLTEGTDGNNRLTGDNAADRILGLAGNDVIKGLRGNDLLRGDSGNDRLIGGKGDDVLRGGRGDDVLRGGAGDDALRGGRGDDVLNGGVGDDILTGGAGADRFVFNTGFGNDTITDFDPLNDTLDLSQFDDVIEDITISIEGSSIVFGLGANSITVEGVADPLLIDLIL